MKVPLGGFALLILDVLTSMVNVFALAFVEISSDIFVPSLSAFIIENSLHYVVLSKLFPRDNEILAVVSLINLL